MNLHDRAQKMVEELPKMSTHKYVDVSCSLISDLLEEVDRITEQEQGQADRLASLARITETEANALRKQLADEKEKSEARLENIKAMSGYLDDVAEALGVPKPGTPVDGIGACWKVMAAIQRRNRALYSLLNVADYEERKRIIDAALAGSV